MNIIPEEEIKNSTGLNLAPMVDFLFLVVAVFATLAVTRAALYESDIQLVSILPHKDDAGASAQNDSYIINLSVNGKGEYKWITEFNEYLIPSVNAIQQEIQQQQTLGLIPKDAKKTKVLLHIDKSAPWEPIAQVIFGVKKSGFDIHPVYDLEEESI